MNRTVEQIIAAICTLALYGAICLMALLVWLVYYGVSYVLDVFL